MGLRNHRSGVPTSCNAGEGNMGWCDSASASSVRLGGSETRSRCVSPMSGSRESLEATGCVPQSVRQGKVCDRNTCVYVTRQSDRR